MLYSKISFSFTEKFNVLWKQNWTLAAKEKLNEFEENLILKIQSSGYKGDKGENEQWSFPGALLYAVTVISTIGKDIYLPREAFLGHSNAFFFLRL